MVSRKVAVITFTLSFKSAVVRPSAWATRAGFPENANEVKKLLLNFIWQGINVFLDVSMQVNCVLHNVPHFGGYRNPHVGIA